MKREHPLFRPLYYVFALGVLQALGLIGFELYRYHTLRQEVARLEAENQALWQRARELEAELRAAQSPEAKEAEARRLGFVKRDETLYARKTH